MRGEGDKEKLRIEGERGEGDMAEGHEMKDKDNGSKERGKKEIQYRKGEREDRSWAGSKENETT